MLFFLTFLIAGAALAQIEQELSDGYEYDAEVQELTESPDLAVYYGGRGPSDGDNNWDLYMRLNANVTIAESEEGNVRQILGIDIQAGAPTETPSFSFICPRVLTLLANSSAALSRDGSGHCDERGALSTECSDALRLQVTTLDYNNLELRENCQGNIIAVATISGANPVGGAAAVEGVFYRFTSNQEEGSQEAYERIEALSELYAVVMTRLLCLSGFGDGEAGDDGIPTETRTIPVPEGFNDSAASRLSFSLVAGAAAVLMTIII
ncbi:hypothetical protein B0I35DRAFT_476416 [Stachybotrys elegans]|uniref:Autophagy-related protein 27 n=1 Tax=Stachybotrys elegans TaxID=80388 RepID=A0A8K0SZB6_9HYPO|nr:hypothetical protein B0I35DRAFT_476416 [Stachybotrys elegans]